MSKPESDGSAIKQWQDMRFGMFIHWGPVSLKGTEIGWSRNKQVPVEEYDNLYKQFNPEKFDADEWVAIAKAAGMKYIVLTVKHHDGFCLWDTQTTAYDIMSTPFKRDVMKEIAFACKKENIVFGIFYSILDWYHPDYNTSDSHGGPGYRLPTGQTADMDRYEKYMKAQLGELLRNYGPLGVLWFDGEWEDVWSHERGVALYDYVHYIQPGILVNNRVDKGRKGMHGGTRDRVYKGDFDTPEQRVGTFQTDWPWESCITLCTQWAWKPHDKMKSLRQCIHTLVRTAGGDGNLLLNVGPMPDGRIEPRQVKRLHEIGKWLKTNGQAIYGTRGGPFKPAEWGVSTHRGRIVYVHVLRWPGKTLRLPGLSEKVASAKLIGDEKVPVVQSEDGIQISLPESSRNSIDKIIVMELDTSHSTQYISVPNKPDACDG